METTIALTMKEQKRVEIIQRVFRRELRMAEAALVLGVTERDAYRVKARIRKEGVRGVVHGNRGRLCSWKFFFSSRRRHTRLQGDWSSDVCSSDLMIRHTRLQGDWSSDVCSSDLQNSASRLSRRWKPGGVAAAR